MSTQITCTEPWNPDYLCALADNTPTRTAWKCKESVEVSKFCAVAAFILREKITAFVLFF